MIKTDSSGNEEWTQTFGGSYDDVGNSVQQTSDGGYIIAGHTASYGAGSFDVYLIKTEGNGNEEWTQTFGGISSDWGSSVQQTTDGGYIIEGVTGDYPNYDVYLIKTDGSGNEDWTQTFGGSNWDEGRSVQQTTDGGYIIAGTTESFGAGEWDVWLIRLESELGVEERFGSLHPSEFILYPPYPNPFNPQTTIAFTLPHADEITIAVYDITGREVARLVDGMKPAGEHSVVFDAKDLVSGVYFARLEAGEFKQTRKMLLIK